MSACLERFSARETLHGVTNAAGIPLGGRVRPCRAPCEAGNRPQRFIRASSGHAFWLRRATAGNLSRPAYVVASYVIDARAASVLERRSISRHVESRPPGAYARGVAFSQADSHLGCRPLFSLHPEIRVHFAGAVTGIAKMNRCPSWLTFFHCIGFPGSGPGNENNIFGVPALNVGVVSTSTAMTSQLRVMK